MALLVAGALSPSPSWAGDDVASAKEHYHRGTKLFDLRRYREAAQEYEAAYELRDDPALLFNIAQAYRFAGDYEQAIGFYRSYLRRLPEGQAKNRDEVQARIREMTELQAQHKRTQDAPPSGTIQPNDKQTAIASTQSQRPSSAQSQKPASEPKGPPAPSETQAEITSTPPKPTQSTTQSRSQSTAQSKSPSAAQSPLPSQRPSRADAPSARVKLLTGIAVAAVGVAGLAAGAGLGAVAHEAQGPVEKTSPFDAALDARARAESAAAYALLAVGGAAAVTGVVLIVLGRRETKAERIAVVPVVGPGRAGALATIHF
jgi:tetratricopeptide (TPR) repeat protein